MFKIIILEIKAITRQYKDIYKISSKEAFMYLLFYVNYTFILHTQFI